TERRTAGILLRYSCAAVRRRARPAGHRLCQCLESDGCPRNLAVSRVRGPNIAGSEPLAAHPASAYRIDFAFHDQHQPWNPRILLGMQVIARMLPDNTVPHEAVIRLNLAVLIFSVCIAVLTGIVFGLSPAFQLSRSERGSLLQAGNLRTAG